jgi:type IV pilus assembly protein PilM
MSNFLSRIFNFGGTTPGQSGGSIVAVDFGSSSAKVVQLRREKGKILLETYGELSTGPYVGMAIGQVVNLGLDKMTEVLIDLFREANVTSKNAALAIPLRSSLLMAIQIPKMSATDIATAIPNEAKRFIPVPISEVILDWWAIPEREDVSSVYDEVGKTEKKKNTEDILIAAIHRDTVGIYRSLAEKIGLSADVYEIETFSLIRSAMENDLSATAIIDFGAGTTKVAIIDYGVVRMSHTINKGAQDITVALSRSLTVSFEKAEEIKRKVGLIQEVSSSGEVLEIINPIIEYVIEEIKRVIIDYQRKQLLRRDLQLPVELGQPFSRIETPAFMEHIFREAGPSFAVAIGLALRKLETMD